MLNNKVYDVLKWVAIIGLPAISTLYYTLAGVWCLPYANEVVKTITALDTCIGVLIGISTISYNNKTQINSDK